MGRMIQADRRATLTEITTRYKRGMQQSISEATTCTILRQMGYNSRRPHQVMAASRRPLSASSVGSRLSSISVHSYLSSSERSHPSSLEDVIVNQYLDKYERPVTTSQALPRNYISPYAKTSARHRKDRPYNDRPKRCSSTPPQSEHASRRSASQDRSTHHKTSAQGSGANSDVDLDKSDITGNSCLLSQSKRNRPVSAPQGHLRYSDKNHNLSSGCRTMPVFKQQPWVIRASAYKNGEKTTPANVSAPTIPLLLDRCTERLKLNTAARRIFLSDGAEAFEPKDIPHDSDIYISCGEPFLDPQKNVKDNVVLSGKMTWTMNGLTLPGQWKIGKIKGTTSKHGQASSASSTRRILVFANGTGKDGQAVSATLEQMEEFLDLCTSKVDLGSSAKCIFDINGEKVEDLRNVPLLDKCLQNSITSLRGPVWLSKGEGFSPTGVKIYIQDVLLALRQRLKSARSYSTQLDHYMNGRNDKITRKEILSLTEEELYWVHEGVNNLIEELKKAIKGHQDQLAKLAPQLVAEEAQGATYVYQHIKPPVRNAKIPSGLQLKIYENGKDFGEILVHVSRKDLRQPMQELLQIIEQRLQRSADFSCSGLRPSRLFDEQGQEIKSAQYLQNEQKVWVSYGEDYRAPVDNILTISFDKVICKEEKGNRVIYKTFVDPDVSLPQNSSWTLHPRFPDHVSPVHLQTSSSEKVGADSLFLQCKLKVNQQLVLYPSIMVEKRSRAPGQTGKKGQLDQAVSTLMSSNVWLITKAGMILSKAMPRICLAVGQPVMMSTKEGTTVEGYSLTLQKRGRHESGQLWGFSNKGSIYAKAYPYFVLTHLEDLNLTEKVSQAGGQQPLRSTELSQAPDAQPLPAGGPGEARQLTVALVRNLEEKHPRASAQRWAIKQEGLSKPGQWKKSKVENPLWNKLTYLWPVLPNGELNEDFNWPIQGSLIANSPPLQRPAYNHPDSHTPVRLRVLRNGDSDASNACVIVGPDLTNMLKKHIIKLNEKKPKKEQKHKNMAETNSLDVEQVEMQQFLERCTQIMNLPSAARRLYNENGVEIFHLRDVERDQLVYVSCGELWIDPELSATEQKRHVLFGNLTSDVSFIRNYCTLRSPENLALEVNGDIVVGARLTVNHCAVQTTSREETDAGSEEIQEEQKEIAIQESDVEEFENAHSRTHKKMDAFFTNVKYPWQQAAVTTEEPSDAGTEQKPEQENSSFRAPRRWQQIHQQQFEYVDGQIVNSAVPNLTLGVIELHAGAEVLLVNRDPDDLCQRWKYMEQNRIFHLESNMDLVLSVSLPKVYPGVKKTDLKFEGCPVILQKHEEHVNGAANQKWCYDDEKKVLTAFYTDQMDMDITAANHTSVCTFTITNTQEISQPGYSTILPSLNEEISMCLSCARTLRPNREMKRVRVGRLFSCASGLRGTSLSPSGPFKCLHVTKTDLSSAEAENTLDYLKQVLSAMRSQHPRHTIAQDLAIARTQRAVKVKAYKNGSGCRNGKVIIASTFLELLDLSTKELELPRPACRVYTADGAVSLELSSLITWAVKDFFKQNPEENSNEEIHSNSRNDPDAVIETSTTAPVDPDGLEVDEYLLCYILRHPIEVWVSCGEPFVSLHAVQRSERQDRMYWLQKKKIVSGRSLMKHKMRHLQARRVKSLAPPTMIPTTNPIQPVSVEGGWTEVTREELKLKEEIENVEMHLSDIQPPRVKVRPAVANNEKTLYTLPTMKRVLAYRNGGNSEQAVYAWGKSMEELLEDCTLKLNMQHQPAAVLYTGNGDLVTSWDGINRDMLVCASTGEPFITKKTSREMIEVRANYARIRKKYGPRATDVIISTPRNFMSPSFNEGEIPSPSDERECRSQRK
ncbi:doublecortin domain-containing protein 1 isoform X2 [Hyperolius riggenbachi]|uniref:doublecortin domain-containing protein 1 isoform X2 n=1 Tax=Hyperolius riggenbachi TaxID=752182 RepID=UPI0035A30E70